MWERKKGRRKIHNRSSSLESYTAQYVYAVFYATSLSMFTQGEFIIVFYRKIRHNFTLFSDKRGTVWQG